MTQFGYDSERHIRVAWSRHMQVFWVDGIAKIRIMA